MNFANDCQTKAACEICEKDIPKSGDRMIVEKHTSKSLILNKLWNSVKKYLIEIRFFFPF